MVSGTRLNIPELLRVDEVPELPITLKCYIGNSGIVKIIRFNLQNDGFYRQIIAKMCMTFGGSSEDFEVYFYNSGGELVSLNNDLKVMTAFELQDIGSFTCNKNNEFCLSVFFKHMIDEQIIIRNISENLFDWPEDGLLPTIIQNQMNNRVMVMTLTPPPIKEKAPKGFILCPPLTTANRNNENRRDDKKLSESDYEEVGEEYIIMGSDCDENAENAMNVSKKLGKRKNRKKTKR